MAIVALAVFLVMVLYFAIEQELNKVNRKLDLVVKRLEPPKREVADPRVFP